MPSIQDDYSLVGGGLLRLKGSSGPKVQKKSKSKRRKHAVGDTVRDDRSQYNVDAAATSETALPLEASKDSQEPTNDSDALNRETQESLIKTATEIRHEERRKKMANDRFKREGPKSHKERVEDFNKYLSRLSEHHDMPRIGPG